MKFKTFRALVIGGAVIAGGGAIGALAVHEQHESELAQRAEDERLWHEAQERQEDERRAAEEKPLAAAAAPAPAGSQPLRPQDSQVLAFADRAISGDKVKDALPGAWKVNLYRDAGHAGVNRLKIDLNRNDKWDEKWSFEGSGTDRVVKREVAPADDEAYTEKWILNGDHWVPEGAAAAPQATTEPAPTATSAPAGSIALRPLDQQILARVAQNIPGDKVKDAIPGPAKVNLYRDAGSANVNRLKIDLDRDEKWDEKWDFETEGGEAVVKRHVAPNDDEVYSDEYRLRGGAWVRK